MKKYSFLLKKMSVSELLHVFPHASLNWRQHPERACKYKLKNIKYTSIKWFFCHLFQAYLMQQRKLPKSKGVICFIFKVKEKVSNKLNLIFRCFFILKEKYQMNWIRSADRISISRSNIRSADRILRSHDATGGAAMKTIKLQHNKPNNNNSHNFSHFEKNCILLVYLSITKQFLS